MTVRLSGGGGVALTVNTLSNLGTRLYRSGTLPDYKLSHSMWLCVEPSHEAEWHGSRGCEAQDWQPVGPREHNKLNSYHYGRRLWTAMF